MINYNMNNLDKKTQIEIQMRVEKSCIWVTACEYDFSLSLSELWRNSRCKFREETSGKKTPNYDSFHNYQVIYTSHKYCSNQKTINLRKKI